MTNPEALGCCSLDPTKPLDLDSNPGMHRRPFSTECEKSKEEWLTTLLLPRCLRSYSPQGGLIRDLGISRGFRV